MKYYLPLMVVLFVMANVAMGAVGDVIASGTSTYIQPAQSQSGPTYVDSSQLSGLEAPVGANVADVQYQGSSSISAYSAPETGGPIQEQLTAEVLRLSPPVAESFAPDASLNFVSSSSPGKMAGGDTGSTQTAQTTQTALTGSSYWYYPGQVNSANQFYVQTSSGLKTIAGCSYGGYLPLFADIKSSGNFYVYEWYPGESAPAVRPWGWTDKGYKKGWFSGDIPGWHILCYNCGIWSNYIYIYVYPKAESSPSSNYPGYVSNPSTISNPSFTGNPSSAGNQGTVTQASLPAGAPTPPDPDLEKLVMPDNNLYRPMVDQAAAGTSYGYIAQNGNALAATNPVQTSYPVLVNSQASTDRPLQANNPAIVSGPISANVPALTSSSTQTCTTCTSSTVVKEGVCNTCPYSSGCPEDTFSGSLTAPSGYTPESYRAVYPRPSTCRCNEYYVQTYPGKLSTVAGVFCDEWLPLWSKISRPGVYWSYEWTMCTSPHGNYCAPDAKNFGYKSTGWYQTWFKGNTPGWHILSYQSNDWSNYVYIYVWPAN